MCVCVCRLLNWVPSNWNTMSIKTPQHGRNKLYYSCLACTVTAVPYSPPLSHTSHCCGEHLLVNCQEASCRSSRCQQILKPVLKWTWTHRYQAKNPAHLLWATETAYWIHEDCPNKQTPETLHNCAGIDLAGGHRDSPRTSSCCLFPVFISFPFPKCLIYSHIYAFYSLFYSP